jgi:hypothetical protein
MVEPDNLRVDDVPTADIRREKLYRQMVVTIDGGPMGRGV